MSYIGKELFWVDRVTSKQTYDGKSLGICIDEGIDSVHKLPVVWFAEPFLGFNWQYKKNVRLSKERHIKTVCNFCSKPVNDDMANELKMVILAIHHFQKGLK
jgi:hypothetical protein